MREAGWLPSSAYGILIRRSAAGDRSVVVDHVKISYQMKLVVQGALPKVCWRVRRIWGL